MLLKKIFQVKFMHGGRFVMAIIPQKQLFDWTQVEELGDLERLKLVLDTLPDEELMRALERERGKGRNDYPCARNVEFHNCGDSVSACEHRVSTPGAMPQCAVAPSVWVRLVQGARCGAWGICVYTVFKASYVEARDDR